MEFSTQNAFQVIFPKYVELLSQSPMMSDEGLETFIRDELPQKIQLVRSIEPTFLAFQTQFTNLILKRPKQQNLMQSLTLKASQKIQKYFSALQLSTDKQITKGSLNNKFAFMNLQSIRTQFRQKFKQTQQLLKEKYFDNYQLEKTVQQEIARRLYSLNEIYYFLKNDLTSVAGKFRVKQHQVLNEINKNGSSGNGNSQICDLLYIDGKFVQNIYQVIDKRYRPFTGKRDFFFSKIKQIQTDAESKVPMNISLLVQSILGKQKYRVNKEVTANLAKQLRTIDESLQQQTERQCKQIIGQVDLLKRQFNQVKNNVFYLDIIRGAFAQKYKMELNKLQNVYYLSNIEKYLQDVQTFTQKLIRVEQRIIDNRKSFMKKLARQIEDKIAGLIAEYEMKNSSSPRNLRDIIDTEFDSLKDALYGLIKNDKVESKQTYNRGASQNDLRKRKADEFQQRRIQMQRTKEQKQRERRQQLQQKASRERIKRQQDKIKLQQRRRAQDQRIRKMRQQREENQRIRKIEQAQKERSKQIQMEEKRKQMKYKEQQDKQRTKQEIRKKQEQKRRKQQQDAKIRQKLKQQKQMEQRRKTQQFGNKKKQMQQAKRRKEEEQRQQQQKLRDQRERNQNQRKQQQQRQRRQRETKLQRQKQQRQRKQRQIREKKQREQNNRREEQQRQKRERQNEKKQRQTRDKQERQRKQRQRQQQIQKQKRQNEQRQKQRKRLSEMDKEKRQKQQRQRKQREQKQKRQKQDRQQRQKQDRQQRQKRQRQQRQQKLRKQKEQTQARQKQQRQKREKQQRQRKQKQQRQRQQREKKQREQRERRQRQRQQLQQKQRKQRQQKQKQQRQKKQLQLKQKQQQQLKQKQQKQKQQKQRQLKLQQEREQKERKQKQERQKRQLEQLMQQEENKKKSKSKSGATDRNSKGKGSSGINYDDLDDMLDDDLQAIEQKESKVSKTKIKKQDTEQDYGDDYEDDFESPQKDQNPSGLQQQGSGQLIQPKQLITIQSIKCLNDYMKSTSYSRKNKPNIQPYNNTDSYTYLFQEFMFAKKLYIFNSAVSNAILDFSKQLMDENAMEDDLKMSMDTIKQEMFNQYASKVGEQSFQPKTMLILPFSFKNQHDIKVIEFLPGEGYFRIILGKEIQDEQADQKIQSVLQGLLHIFDIQTQPTIQTVVIPEDSQNVLNTFDKQLPCLILLYCLHYEIQLKSQPITVNQYTVERFFYTLQILKPLYEAIQNNQQQLVGFYVKETQKYSTQGSAIQILPIEINSAQPQYQQQLQQYALQAKQMFMQNKTVNTMLVLFQVLIVAQQEESQEQQPSVQKIAIYCSMQRTAPKPTITYYIISKDQFDKQNASTLFDIVSQGDDQFEVIVYMDYTRHNGLSQYSDWTLPLWARSIQKRKLTPPNAFRALTFAMTPYYVAFKEQD